MGELPAQRRALEREISHAESRLQHLVNAIATGRATEAVFAELEKEEAKKKVLMGNSQVSPPYIDGRNWTALTLNRTYLVAWGICRNYWGDTFHRLARCLEN